MKEPLSRRRFLASAATTLSLPFLDSIAGRTARAACTPTPQRFVAWFVPNGIHMPDWTPTTTGRDWVMPPILAPLAPVRRKIAVITGLDHHETAQPADPPGGHASGTGSFLTMIPVHANQSNPNRTSIDQVIAKETAACGRPFPSLQLGLQARGDGCDDAPCSFLETISWDRNTPLPAMYSPQDLFDRLFKGVDGSASTADAQRRRAIRSSVLDHVREEARLLTVTLDAADRRKLEEFTTAVRELEVRLQNTSGGGASGSRCTPPGRPSQDALAPFPERAAIMGELMAIALQCDLTRVISYMMARGSSSQDFSFLLGSSAPHHKTSHHGGNSGETAKLSRIARWEVEQLSRFLQRLEGMTEGNGRTVLDNTVVYFSSEISDGDKHKKYDMPVLLAGSTGQRLKVDGSHVSYTKMSFPRPLLGPSNPHQHTGQVFVSILNAFGIQATSFGEAKGPLMDLLA